MKNFLLRLAAALALTTCVALVSTQANAQQPARDTQDPGAAQPQNNQAQNNDAQPQDAKPFMGTIKKEKGKLVLKDTVANVSYQLDDQDKAKQFEGKQVKVTGKLDMTTNLIHVENIEATT